MTVEARAREILRILEDKDSSLEVTLEEDELVKESRTKQKDRKCSNEFQDTSRLTMMATPTHDLQLENELTKALLVLNPELITPKQALEIIYDLHAKAQCKSP